MHAYIGMFVKVKYSMSSGPMVQAEISGFQSRIDKHSSLFDSVVSLHFPNIMLHSYGYIFMLISGIAP